MEMDYIKAVMEHHEEISKSFLTLGEYFYNIHEKQLYKPKFRTFKEYSLTLPFASSYTYRLFYVYKKFIVEYNFTPEQLMYTNMSTLFDLIPIVNSKPQAEHWMNLAVTLSRKELRYEISKHKADVLKVKKLSTESNLTSKN